MSYLVQSKVFFMSKRSLKYMQSQRKLLLQISNNFCNNFHLNTCFILETCKECELWNMLAMHMIYSKVQLKFEYSRGSNYRDLPENVKEETETVSYCDYRVLWEKTQNASIKQKKKNGKGQPMWMKSSREGRREREREACTTWASYDFAFVFFLFFHIFHPFCNSHSCIECECVCKRREGVGGGWRGVQGMCVCEWHYKLIIK